MNSEKVIVAEDLDNLKIKNLTIFRKKIGESDVFKKCRDHIFPGWKVSDLRKLKNDMLKVQVEDDTSDIGPEFYKMEQQFEFHFGEGTFGEYNFEVVEMIASELVKNLSEDNV